MKVLIWLGCLILAAIVRVFIDYTMDALGYIPGGLVAGLLAMAQFSAVWYSGCKGVSDNDL